MNDKKESTNDIIAQKEIKDNNSPKRKQSTQSINDNKYTYFIENEQVLDKESLEKIKDEIRISSVYDVFGIKTKGGKNFDKISSEFKKYEKFFNINLSISNRKDLKLDASIDISKIIEILTLPSDKRTFNDIFLMKKYLLTTKID